MFLVFLQQGSNPARAQHTVTDSVTVRAVNSIPPENIGDLIAGGIDLTEADIDRLIRSPLDGKTVRVVAVLLSDPRNSGLSEVVDGHVARVHFFVRDVAADTAGTEGMGIQVIDERWEEHGVLDLTVGDVIDLTARVVELFNGLHLQPISITNLGTFDDLGYSTGLVTPDQAVRTGDLNRSFADGRFQANWASYTRLHGGYVCLDRGVIATTIIPANPDRVDWSLASEGEARVYTYDASHRFRNDTRATYPDVFNTRNDPFLPPPPGALVQACGFVLLQAFNDPEGVGVPAASSTGSMLSLVPYADADFDVLELPPIVDSTSYPVAAPRSDEPVSVTAAVTFDPARRRAGVVLRYVVGKEPGNVVMNAIEENVWRGNIPPSGEDGAFVSYHIRAIDNTGAATTGPVQWFRTFDDGIANIEHIQRTYNDGAGPSLYEGQTIGMDVRAVVQSAPSLSGLLVVQDDPFSGPWTGIRMAREPALLTLNTGDIVRISSARVVETDGSTVLHDVTLTVEIPTQTGRFDPVKIGTDELVLPDVAASYDGMRIRLSNVSTIARLDFGTGDVIVTNASAFEAARVSLDAPSIPESAKPNPWDRIAFIDGFWLSTVDGWKLHPEIAEDIGIVVNVDNDVSDALPEREVPRLSAYPNPSFGDLRVTYLIPDLRSEAVPTGEALRLGIYDVSGRLVLELGGLPRSGLANEHRVDTSQLPAGTYLVRLSYGRTVLTHPVIVVH